VAVSDPIKATTAEALASLKALGIRTVMATGDGLTTARTVGRKLSIEEVHGEVKPADKLELVAKLQREGRIVAMAGDGINDAPALAKANVGIAGNRSSQANLGRDRRQHEAEPRICARLQLDRHPGGRWRALSDHRLAAVPDDRCPGDELQLGVGHLERAEAAIERARCLAGTSSGATKSVGIDVTSADSTGSTFTFP
jgi:hypothetical protein